MARHPDRTSKPRSDERAADPWLADTWVNPLPVPEVHEGGESTWDLWHEAKRQLDVAFAPTQPSTRPPLGPDELRNISARPLGRPLTADAVMVLARRNNRVCPQPPIWTQLYRLMHGDRFQDLPPPPVERWVWTKLSDLQKRLRFREHVEWAERHHMLPEFVTFIEGLSEADWVHMGDD